MLQHASLPSSSRLVAPEDGSFRIGGDSDVLTSIHDPSVNVAIWARLLPPDLGPEIAARASRKDDFEGIFDAAEIKEGRLFDPADEASPLRADVGRLLQLFAALSGVPRIQVFFGAVRNDQCRKFHVDYVRLRLVTTYLGPGTEWLPEDAVCREELDLAPPSPAEANRRIVRDASKIRRANAGDVVLLKGERYPDHERAAVHRSPPIQELGLTRVVLVATTYDKGS
ncbi:DUF1826 domain-containing protein [Polyangium jinanense]|uniref:DUF1826 domain-containing protein n=1 Tax=Polyangium jinanense TaxID=2829994 RepID=A0A9X4AWD1_9BACT|nr:DUF1826 domain-containing protein [Polyangium jinanense]MDC3958799.1 DUF1826 domain-containing protein [Polyangium jinanense]MDC3985220.1 DUF1826 domain-containing protein [Polyangium jinanense]